MKTMLALCLCLLALGCGSTVVEVVPLPVIMADASHDVLLTHDAGADVVTELDVDASADAGGPDGSSDTDDAGEDAGTEDSGDMPDAGELDAGVVDDEADAGCTPDCDGRCGGPDGCGHPCPDICVAPETCGGGGAQRVCGEPPDTGTDAGHDAGAHDAGALDACCVSNCSQDDCDIIDRCGHPCPDNCVSPNTCGGGGRPNLCGCTPTCPRECGGTDGCGGMCWDDCQGKYGGPEWACSANTCVCFPRCEGRCGYDSDGCHGTCPKCKYPLRCVYNRCVP